MKFFNKIIKSLLLVSVLALLAPSLYADSKGVIVVSKDVNVKNLSKKELERIFLGKTTIWDNGKRIQIGLSTADGEKTDHFFKEMIGKNQRRFKKYWLKLVFAGYGIAPKLFSDNSKVISYTKRQEGVISFITAEELENIEGLKIVSIDGKKSF
ncbi:hypothetical protein FJR48_04625 [Sulfurimonas lithotrophica]|uniref:PBP domain-containing protein n=1 Tax=Sulfurimonas lithotrophica TaxID=2590022 RepID=A0A5P8P0E3_9BACT|nr:hypothetical protein [Sulfurimonas lithotrophica]QFR49047.1 hypothetical protein FJR48_04625 [Sulfurimonas lithotrophica]